MLWTLFDKVQSAIIKEHQATPGTADGSLPVGLDPSLAWLVESSEPEPAFNANTERLEPAEAITIDTSDTRTGTRVFGWGKVPLTEAQLRDRAIQVKLKREAAQVAAISEKLENDEPVTASEVATVVRFISLRDRLDLSQ